MFFSPHIIIQIFAILFDQHEWLTTQNETHIGAKKNHVAFIIIFKKLIIQRTIFQINRLNIEYHKNHNSKSQKNKKKTLSSRKFLAPLWNSMCQSVLLKHILLCPCMLRAFGKKNWSINFDRWRLRFVPSFCHTKKGYILTLFFRKLAKNYSA